MVALSNNAVVLIRIFQQRNSKHLIEVVLSHEFVILPCVTLVILAIRLSQQLTSPFVDLLSLLYEAIMELRVNVYLAIVGLVVFKRLQSLVLLTVFQSALVLLVEFQHFFEVFLTLGFGGLHIGSKYLGLIDLFSLSKVLKSNLHVIVPNIAWVLLTPLYDSIKLLLSVQVVKAEHLRDLGTFVVFELDDLVVILTWLLQNFLFRVDLSSLKADFHVTSLELLAGKNLFT